jgi:hypothetical protein
MVTIISDGDDCCLDSNENLSSFFFMATGTTLTMGPEGIIDWSNTKTRL